MVKQHETHILVTFLISANLLAGTLLDKIGRKYSIILITIPRICASIWTIFVTEVWMLIFCRMVMVSTDNYIYVVIPVYVSEIANVSIAFMSIFFSKSSFFYVHVQNEVYMPLKLQLFLYNIMIFQPQILSRINLTYLFKIKLRALKIKLLTRIKILNINLLNTLYFSRFKIINITNNLIFSMNFYGILRRPKILSFFSTFLFLPIFFQKEFRASLGTFLHILACIGIVATLSIGPFVSYTIYNCLVAGVIVLTSIPLLFLPESPVHLYTKGKLQIYQHISFNSYLPTFLRIIKIQITLLTQQTYLRSYG